MVERIAVVEYFKLCPYFIQVVKIEVDSKGTFTIWQGFCNSIALGVSHQTLTAIMTELVVANAVGTNQIALVLNGSRPCEHPPSLLTTLRPVGNSDDGIVGTCPAIARPNGKAQVVAGK